VTDTRHALLPAQVTLLNFFSTVKVVSTVPELLAVTIFTPAMLQSDSVVFATFLHSLTTSVSFGVNPDDVTWTDSPEARPAFGVTTIVCLEVVVGATVVEVAVVGGVVEVGGAAVVGLELQAARPTATASKKAAISLLMDGSLPSQLPFRRLPGGYLASSVAVA